MHLIGQTCIYVWAVATLVAVVSAIVFLIRLITKKNRKTAKRVFWIATAVAIGSFVLYGVISPVTRCKHEFTMVIDQPPTCTVDGKTEQYCPLCDFTKKDTIKATGHNMVTDSKREPTYEASGELVEKCSICGYEVVTEIDMLIKETESVETKPVETKPTETKPIETKPVETEPVETKPVDTKPTETKPIETKPADKPKTDKEIAKEVSDSIDNIGNVTLDKEDEILKIKDRYDQLTKKQKRRVKNHDILENAISELDFLHELEKLKDDPTYTLNEEDMVGIWKERNPKEERTEYYYFAPNGYIYYISCEYEPTQSTFTSEYRISTSYEFEGYDREKAHMKGFFYCYPVEETLNFAVIRDEQGRMVMTVTRHEGSFDTGTGSFGKTSIPIDNRVTTGNNSSAKNKQKCEVCSREGTNKYESFTGQTEYYCSQHYKELLEMLESFGLG